MSVTANYPKAAVLARIDERLASLADRERAEVAESAQEIDEHLAEVDAFLNRQADDFTARMAEARLDYETSDADPDVRLALAKKYAESVERLWWHVPRAGYRFHGVEAAARVVRAKYERERLTLESKRAFLDAAEAPDGFSLSALEELRILEIIR